MTPGGEKMPNIKSAKKRVKVTSTKHESNIPVKGSMKTAVKKVEKDASMTEKYLVKQLKLQLRIKNYICILIKK